MPDAEKSPAVEPSKPRIFKVLGPGLITGASDDDPSGIATYSQAGALFGFGLLWTMVLAYPLMAAVQEISARIGRTTGKGLAGNIIPHYPPLIVYGLVGLLFMANIINIGANLGAMGDAVALLVGGPKLVYVAAFGILCTLMQVFMTYTRYVAVLKWLTIALLSYIATMFVIDIPWGDVAKGLVVPNFSSNPNYWQTIVAIFGTTISPYLFFWQASQEVEDIHEIPRREPLLKRPHQAPAAEERIRIDTLVGMAFSNVVAISIIITVGATLHPAGTTDIQSSAQAAEALKPIGGSLAFVLFALGIIGTGLLSIPVLAGSAAYAFGEALKWKVGLSLDPTEGKAFYGMIALSTVVGIAINFSGMNPIKALYYSAVINGLVAVPIIVIMMLIATDAEIMGRFKVRGCLGYLGWATAIVMALASFAMVVQAL
ncbi:natural resistance-associated macrophage protein [Hyphomicrobium denitrificans 1NES1]|uniref:Natural resistance-associated macrophage protein n=1 Tax=Hyphomicrobium denitrificans 1NES1 TaxID=670307 RepID=N0BC94_9HYPH|nr:natural resistance-associated macrophage protein [Hyphomicrobium denitrificans 1NES1]